MATSDARPEPPSAVAIRAAVARLRAQPAMVVGVVLALFVLGSLTGAFYAVGNGESAALQRFGQLIDGAVQPGLGVRIPWGVDEITRVPTGEVRRAEVTGDFGQPLALVTGDENLMEMAVVVQYKITDLAAFLFRLDDPIGSVTQAVRGALVATVGAMPVDDVLTSGKAQIQNQVRTAAQAMLDRYGAGLTLLNVNLQWAKPPIEAAQAFRAVNDAKADAATLVNQAQSERERTLSLARGEASRLSQEARGRAAARVQEAGGATRRFATLLEQQRRAPAQTSMDLYLRTVQRVLPRAKLVLLAPGQAPRIDLNLLERAQP